MFSHYGMMDGMDPGDLYGALAEGVTIDELVMPNGSILAIDIQADFSCDGDSWAADVVWIKTFTRTQDGEHFQFMDKWTIATRENGWAALVEAAEKWADKNLDPTDYVDA